jgi:hypothetical protein
MASSRCRHCTVALIPACRRRRTFCVPNRTLRQRPSLVLHVALTRTPSLCKTPNRRLMAAIWQWEHFRRHEGLQPYQDSHLRYATCNFCTAEPTITLTHEIKAELEGDRRKGRARALSVGFILGRDKEMSRHLKTCKKARPEHREHATRDLSTATRKSSEAIRTQPDSSEQSRVPSLPASTKRKRSETSVAEDIRMFSVGGKRHRYDPELHS